jgi:hypothetical protein
MVGWQEKCNPPLPTMSARAALQRSRPIIDGHFAHYDDSQQAELW